jgi:hypothetical protein
MHDRQVESGQLLFDFDVQASPGSVSVLERGGRGLKQGHSPDRHHRCRPCRDGR